MSEMVTDIFGIDVFNDTVMAERLPEETYAALKKTIENGEELDAQVAEVVANAMKDWAIEKGATHYSHWFQPMTGITAEKHDAFITPAPGGKVMMEFSGKSLLRANPMLPVSRTADFVQLLRHVAIPHGTVLLRHLYVKMRQGLPFVFRRRFALIPVRLWIRKLRFFVPWKR